MSLLAKYLSIPGTSINSYLDTTVNKLAYEIYINNDLRGKTYDVKDLEIMLDMIIEEGL